MRYFCLTTDVLQRESTVHQRYTCTLAIKQQNDNIVNAGKNFKKIKHFTGL